MPLSRRELLAGAAGSAAAPRLLRVAGEEVEVRIAPVSEHTVRISLVPVRNGQAVPIPQDGSLVRESWGEPVARFRTLVGTETVRAGAVAVTVSADPLTVDVASRQRLRIDSASGAMSFDISGGPLLGLGEGGPQFDRRGSVDTMRSGQGGYRLHTHGGRVPIPWLIGTSGWAMFIHQPAGTFDFTGAEGRFEPASPLPLDVCVVASSEPPTIMAEYARLTGHAALPPLWALGYQQSHRTLADRDEVLAEARTFREKKLPCDALIYLGTGFCPSGWNTANGSFSFNPDVFSDPKEMIDSLHREHFRVVLHAVILSRALRGTAQDRCELQRFDDEEAACYWDAHRKDFALGVDGWWPDEGDPLDVRSRLARIRMYWDGPRLDRPNERPYALHRNGYAGMQRYGAFLWSGDVYSTWETLRTHVPVAINTALTGIPYWGTDIGGFVPTREFTGELYVRWFQFGAFTPLFRAHGRTWKLRLPWGWNTGELGPNEISGYGEAANPDPSELHNAHVEPICRKYLELRYRLLPYLYSAVRECCRTGMPVLRALWLHYPDDSMAAARGDEYLWGRDLLVAPVTEKGARSRRLYVPRGAWYDFWTSERMEGGREVDRAVDLATMPLYVRAGAIVPFGPVKQYTGETVDAPEELVVYPGADGAFFLYNDDGISFDYRRGEWTGIEIAWSDRARLLSLKPAAGSRPQRRRFEARLVTGTARAVEFDGRAMEVLL